MSYQARMRRKRRQLVHGTRRWLVNSLELWPNRPKVLAIGPPKSGTNLLRRCLRSLPHMLDCQVPLDRPADFAELEQKLAQVYRGSFIKAHVHFTRENYDLVQDLGLATILILRDPRDLSVSLLHWATYINERHRLGPYLRRLEDDDQRLLAIINGVPAEELGDKRELEPIDEFVGIFVPWMDHGSCTVRFEDLIGTAGGGDAESQRGAIAKIARHLDMELDTEEIEGVAAGLFSRRSRTFRKGQIGDWRNRFTSEHKAAFKEVAGQLLVDLGYEPDLDW